MADNIQFRVDAVLSNPSQLQQQINKVKGNLNLTINNTQALQAVKAVQQQINTLQQSMNNINLNFNGNDEVTPTKINKIPRILLGSNLTLFILNKSK